MTPKDLISSNKAKEEAFVKEMFPGIEFDEVATKRLRNRLGSLIEAYEGLEDDESDE